MTQQELKQAYSRQNWQQWLQDIFAQQIAFEIQPEQITLQSGNLTTQSANPKRFTYVLGENESTRTAADRLKTIAGKAGNIALKDVKDAFSVETLTKQFYSELFDWYQWALSELNRPINERTFAIKGGSKENEHYGIKTLYRDAVESSYFKKTHTEIIQLFESVPFLNGGLFECLDKEQDDKGKIMYFDGFSRAKGRQKRAFFPNCLFFDTEQGLISILKRYNFTIEENISTDVEVALDPELLGKVFENLLGAYNPETRETARKQSGSFYTPREIVTYMVDESLKAYCLNYASCDSFDYNDYKAFVENLFSNHSNQNNQINHSTDKWKQVIYNTLLKIKILDPACGSGAFPMGVLNRIVDIFEKLGLPPTINRYSLKLHLNGGALAKQFEKCGYKTFARTGDIYCLFYERGWQLLKPQGHLCFITSNKWMRAGYGENTRKFFAEHTNPEQLIDFAGVKIFESATVDTNILMFAKDKNQQQTRACIVKKNGIKDLSLSPNVLRTAGLKS